MKVVILGATGFIGRHLSERLAAEGVEVTAVGRRAAGSLRLDLCDPSFPAALPGDADHIVHLAQSTAPFPEGAGELYLVNTLSVLRTLAFAVRHGVPSVVVASTGSVYGGAAPSARAFSEDDRCEPRDFYAVTKRHAEEIATQFAALLRVTVVRLFAPYGPGQSERLVPRLIERIARRQPVTLPADGLSLRINPIYVSDVVEALVRAMTRGRGGVYNVGGAEILSIVDMARAIGRGLGIEPVFETKGEAALPCVGDVAKIARDLAFAPAVRFDEGIARTLAARTRAVHA
jgi:UDP-glucose 4-epimerase